MSTDTATETKGRPVEAHHQTHEHEHPSDLLYVKIAAILGVITAAEVSTYFIFEDPYNPINIVGLLFLMVIKFATVCSYFMHLKFDHPIFRRVFVAGLVLAVIVYVGVLLTAFEFWSSAFEGG